MVRSDISCNNLSLQSFIHTSQTNRKIPTHVNRVTKIRLFFLFCDRRKYTFYFAISSGGVDFLCYIFHINALMNIVNLSSILIIMWIWNGRYDARTASRTYSVSLRNRVLWFHQLFIHHSGLDKPALWCHCTFLYLLLIYEHTINDRVVVFCSELHLISFRELLLNDIAIPASSLFVFT